MGNPYGDQDVYGSRSLIGNDEYACGVPDSYPECDGGFTIDSFRLCEKFLDFRQRTKSNALISPPPITPPIAMPAIAPDDNRFPRAADGVGVPGAVGVLGEGVPGDEPSSWLANGSPGDLIYGDFLAASCCWINE